jgi:murein DD-endopeptidase MepM/ murein hydrolase activator NlpD
MTLPGVRLLRRSPVPASARVSSPFGARVDPVTGKPAGHSGVDWAVPLGTPLVAADDGVVAFILRWDGLPAATTTTISGDAIGMRRDDGVSWSYSHLSRVDVVVGQRLRAGDVVGLSGTSGKSTGPHLHFRVDVPGLGVVDPLSMLPAPSSGGASAARVLGVVVGGVVVAGAAWAVWRYVRRRGA